MTEEIKITVTGSTDNRHENDVPVRLNIGVDDKSYCAQFDVFFNGKRQTQCLIADTQHGYIKRYKSLFDTIVRRNGRIVTEELHGTVEIVRRSKSSGP